MTLIRKTMVGLIFAGAFGANAVTENKPDRYVRTHLKVAEENGRTICEMDGNAPLYQSSTFSPVNKDTSIGKCEIAMDVERVTLEVDSAVGTFLDYKHWNSVQTTFTLSVRRNGASQSDYLAFADTTVPGAENKKLQLETFVILKKATVIVTVDFIL